MKTKQPFNRFLLVNFLLAFVFSSSTLLGQEKNYKPVEVLGKTVVEVNANLGDMVEVVYLIRNNSSTIFILPKFKPIAIVWKPSSQNWCPETPSILS